MNKNQASTLLKNLEALVNKHRDGQSGGAKSWWSAIVIFFVVLIGVIVFAYVSSRKSKELARLRHQANKNVILKRTAEVKARAKKNDVLKEHLDNEIKQLRQRVDEIETDISAVEKARSQDRKAISNITSWQDMI